MQVLKDGKVEFVLTVGVCILTSLWICLWFSHSSSFCCLTLKKNASCYKSSQIMLAEGSWALLFSFLVVLQWLWLSLGYSKLRCPVSSLLLEHCAARTLHPVHLCQTRTNNPPHFVILWSIHEEHWVGANYMPPLLHCPLNVLEVPAWRFCSTIGRSVSMGLCCPRLITLWSGLSRS